MGDEATLKMGPEDEERARARSRESARFPTPVPGYEPEGPLGRGAYGEIWLAVDRNTGRRVAIKFYNHRGGVDWSLLSREVEKLAFLFNDRYIVQLLEVGWEADPPYYVMEYMEHGSLEERLQGPLPLEEAAHLFREVATGLAHAHNKGILHCDLKPANVLLDHDHRPRLADFGQARLTHEQSPALGSLFYMAPEQASLDASPDARWDVYALGALLYRMLTGAPPHHSPELLASLERTEGLERRLEAYRNHILQAPPPSAHRRAKGVDRALADIIDRCLDARPSRRFPNVQAVLAALALRDAQRARRPLLILGGVGPALTLLLVFVLGMLGLRTAMSNSREALVERALQQQELSAQVIADGVADDIDRRWRVLERAASRPYLHKLLRNAEGKKWGSPARKALQKWAVNQYKLFGDPGSGSSTLVESNSWVVLDNKGKLLANGPLLGDPKTYIDKNFSYRDYFHGRGKDFPPGTKGLTPLKEPRLTSVFPNRSHTALWLGWSVPVWAGEPGKSDILGVLFLSMEVGKSHDLRKLNAQPGEGGRHSRRPKTALIDMRRDWTGQRGLILYHPALEQRPTVDEKGNPSWFRWRPEASKLPQRLVERLEQPELTEQGELADESGLTSDDYHDPAGMANPAYGGRWLAAFRPVIVERDDGTVHPTGWVVVVEERYDQVVEPVDALRRKLLVGGLIGLLALAGVTAGAWLFVARAVRSSTLELPFLGGGRTTTPRTAGGTLAGPGPNTVAG
jgi:hypothetical protein